MNKSLSRRIHQLLKEVDEIPEDRKKLLLLISDLIKQEISKNGHVNIVFICTHNSRRSQLAEAWLVAAYQHFDVRGISAFSGGTEATSFNIRMVVALRNDAFHLRTDGPRDNPRYVLQALEASSSPHIMFSKVYDHPFNPRTNMMVLMVCSDADKNCPVVLGSTHRISLSYEDPKEFDDTPMESQIYTDKVHEIGREILFLMKHVKDL